MPPITEPAFDDDLRASLLAAVRAAADAARPLVGGGDGDAVDAAAVDALRLALAAVPADLRVVSGEGEKDDAPMLHPGERFGTGAGPALDLVVDPVDGTRLAAAGRPGAMAILAVAPRGAYADPGPAFYLDKLVHARPAAVAGGPPDAGLSLDLPVAENLARLASALDRPVSSLRVAVQARPRNAAVADAVRAAGAILHRFEHGDVERVAYAAAAEGDLDLLLGIGGAPEGLLEAAIVRAHGGVMLARFAPQSAVEADRVAAFADGLAPDAAERGLAAPRGIALARLCAASALVVIAPVTACALAPARSPLVVVDDRAPALVTAALPSD
ncbi:fructose-1,6-bisphosphatase II [Agromyces sp. CF514]|uniref:fructose-bisphosphatase class II n=1 Tax=Agromyces sp. CF514 TaxID=1881031 RepID=UPI0008E175FC|nr:fructose-bisphosphatase class II [Agromyces sp. CF514]SFR73995.1 fructose-1,6-bisphosphatase II [Agromyces sp. CF514]